MIDLVTSLFGIININTFINIFGHI